MEKILSLIMVLSIIGCANDSKKENTELMVIKPEAPIFELDYMVEQWSESFVSKIDSTYKATLNFYLADSSEACHVIFSNNKFELFKHSTDTYNLSFSSTKDHFNKIFRGDMTAMTSMGQATSSDPIFYQRTDDIGVRSAWYQINKGEQVNEPGDTNTFPQYFIITQGQGYAKIGNDTIEVKKNEAYFIPPNQDHVFWNENDEPIIYIFLAWGKGA